MTTSTTSNIVTDAVQDAIDIYGPDALAKVAAALPSALGPTVISYGPSILALGRAGIADWIATIQRGDTLAAWSAIVPTMGNMELVDALNRLHGELAVLNQHNADRVKQEQDAINAILKILLQVGQAALTAA